MSDILSQAEIDELLNALSTGIDTPAEEQQAGAKNAPMKARPYDFKTANRFPKEHIRTFNIVFQTFCQLFSNRLSSLLRIACECEMLSIEECSFNEYNNAMPTPVILAVYKAPPMHGSQLIMVSPEVAYMIISRLFGGVTTGESSKQFTEIELALVERVLRQMASVFDEAWNKVFRLNMQIERIETSSQFVQIVPINEPVAVIGLNLKTGTESGLMSICIPHTAIEPVAKQLNTRLLFSGTTQEGAGKQKQTDLMSEKIVQTPVSLVAFFEKTPATVVDIVNLQVGDVIRLNHKTSQPLTINVQHIPKFHANVGTMGSNYALQIIDVIKEEYEDEPFTR